MLKFFCPARLILLAPNYNNVSWFSPARLLHPTTLGLIGFYAAIRALSWWSVDYVLIQAAIVMALTFGFGIAFFARREIAWCLLATELALGGAGNFFQFAGLSLRTILLGTFLGLAAFFSWYKKTKHPHHWFAYASILVFLATVWAIIQGFWHGNTTAAIIGDLIPFVYLLLAVPLAQLQLNPKERNYLLRLGSAWLISTALFSVFVFILYVHGMSQLHDLFYQWLRDMAGAKITFLTPWFYRIVFPEQLLLVPAALVCLSILMRRDAPHWKWWGLYVCAALSLALNFSRGYFLGLIVGTAVLLWQHKLWSWFKTSAIAATTLILIFIGVSVITSRGTQTGLPLLTGRVASIGTPANETSSATRLLLLPVIKTKIAAHPIAGNGLGSTITFYDPYLERTVTTGNFDWGYLELWAEFGIGALAYLGVWVTTGIILVKKIRASVVDTDVLVAVLAGLIALMVIALTTPALFHVFGTVFLAAALAIAIQPPARLRSLTALVARFFHLR